MKGIGKRVEGRGKGIALMRVLGMIAFVVAIRTVAFGATIEVAAPDATDEFYPLASGASGLRSPSSNSINVEYLLEDVEIGGAFVTEETPWHIGDFLTAADMPKDIDWQATADAIEVSSLTNKVKVYRSSSDVNRRLLFISGGTTVAIPWQLTDGTALTNHYYVAKVVSERPHRIFWTEGGSEQSPYNGTPVNLSGRFVEILGDPAVIRTEYAPPTVENGPLNIVCGVYFEAVSQTLHAKAREVNDGPRGQFVLAYYDTAERRRLIGVTVVEALPYDPQCVKAFVGDRLLPTGGGHAIDDLLPIPQKGTTKSNSGEDGSPWIGAFVASSPYHPEDGAYFALSPTTAENDEDKQEAVICWEAEDEMNTLWPFELDSYVISWNPDSPRLVVPSDGGNAKLFVPTNYMSVALGDWMVAEGEMNNDDPIATLEESSNTITVSGPGWFSLTFADATETYRLTIHAVTNDDASVCVQDARTVDIGERLKPFAADTFSATNLNMIAYAALFSPDAEGYIFTNGSARVWNPHLYHEPKNASVADLADNAAAVTSDDADPLGSLRSSIYLVSEMKTDELVEVWWYREVLLDEGGKPLPTALTFPGFVNRYRAEMRTSGHHEIALTSQRGSQVPTSANDGTALYVGDAGFSAVASGSGLGALQGRTIRADEGFTIGCWVNPSPREMADATRTAGRMLTVALNGALGAACEEISLVSTDGSGSWIDVCTTVPDATTGKAVTTVCAQLKIQSGDWTHLALSFGKTTSSFGKTVRTVRVFQQGWKDAVGTLSLPGGDLTVDRIVLGADEGAATGWAADELTVWNFEAEGPMSALWTNDGKGGERELADHELLRFSMDDTMDVTGGETVPNAYGYFILAAVNPYSTERGLLGMTRAPHLLDTGAPVVRAFAFPASSAGAFPRIYRQTDSGQPGLRFNYEHAFVDGDQTVWALRLGTSSDRGHVLVEYDDNGRGAMKVFEVIDNRTLFPPASTVEVACQMLPPRPLRDREGYWNDLNSIAATICHRDRKLNQWAYCAGFGLTTEYYYLMDESFDLATGESVARSADGLDYFTWTVRDWQWTAVWPKDAPVMKVAQTLTKAVTGLPEVWSMASCDILYPKSAMDANATNNVVRLVDPVTAKTAPLEIKSQFTGEYGFEVGPSGTTTLRKGKYYFPSLPPSIADRFYVDTNADVSNRVVLVGDLVEPAAGNAYLRWNLLSADEIDALKELCTKEDATDAWCKAIDELAHNDLETIITQPHKPVANYALFADGHGSGYVTFIENDSTNTAMVAEGDPINVQVILVTNELYAGTCVTVASTLNKLSELLTVQYNDAYPKMTNDFELTWYRRDPPADGSVPVPSVTDGTWEPYARGKDQTSFVLGKTGTTLDELVNKYYFLHYEPRKDSPAAATCGEDASVNTDPALAEGWVQRVLNAVTPFAQRVEDFYSNPSDIWYTMFEQIGRPYQGDVALNNDNLTEVGLIELYRTIFNKAWKMSLAVGVDDMGVNKQLLLAASRLADLYQLLGAEAYADAKNPLISQGFNDTYLGELQNLPSSTFCFQNQVRTLLDEELALLRGRALGNAPNMTTQPCFNRLYWNFTKGITEGEVAYVNNYGIRADQGVLTIDQAAKQYPQGHGDAWGHYLSSIQLYYKLLAHPNFDWYATMMEMNLSQAVANEDYYDEQKFADSAVKLAQIGLDTMDLTARQSWRDNSGDMRSGYADATTGAINGKTVEQAFGYGDWAKRTILGGIYNWAFVNALVPAQSEQSNNETGLKKIDRSTVTQLSELCTVVDQVQQKVNTVDAGLNPLGLSQNAVPMDIDPDALAAKNSHFDQILERAERALANCEAVLDFANQYGARLQQIQNAETTAGTEQENKEADYNRDLIAIYGTPYPGDIGTGCLYEQGYEGPDLYHYMYMDLAEFGLSETELEVAFSTNLTFYTVHSVEDGKSWKDIGGVDGRVADDMPVSSTTVVKYDVSSGGIVLKPDNFGVRRMEGKLQSAYRDYLAKYVAAKRALSAYDVKVGTMNDYAYDYYKLWALKQAELIEKEAYDIWRTAANLTLLNSETLLSKWPGLDVNDLHIRQLDDGYGDWTKVFTVNVPLEVESQIVTIPNIMGVGTTTITDPSSTAKAALMGPLLATTLSAKAAKSVHTTVQTVYDNLEIVQSAVLAAWDTGVGYWENDLDVKNKYWDLVGAVKTAAYDAQDAIGALATAEAAYRAVVAEGEALQAERERIRKQQSNNATQYRYADMYNRVQRNNALTKYSTAFDTAQRYVWELAKVYDYETGLLSSDPQAGDKFLAEIIGARQLGYPGVSTSQATDKGLYDIVNRMKENWAVLKGRLGVNNPANTATEFSLRYELFRIKPDETGDGAWQEELKKYWVDDLKADPDYRRYCQPLVSTAGPVAKEPGLVIPFSTVINNAENFFGKTLQGGDHAYSSADYATKVHAVGVAFDGYDALTVQTAAGLAADPNVYLVPVGHDYMRAPSGDLEPAVLAWNVVDQVLPLPYAVGSTQLDDTDWIATFSGLDGTRDSAAKIRRHSTFRANGETYATRLVGRSVWNDRWILVIPASSLNANREAGLTTFINGVKDIKLKIQAYSRSGN